MKVLIYLHHPAHFFLFKNVIANLKNSNNKVSIVATQKDVLEDLLKSAKFQYENFLPKGRKDNKLSISWGLLTQDFKLFLKCIINRPDILIGTSTEICHIGFILRIPNIFVNEDDVSVVPLVGKIAHPFAKHLLSPSVCNTGNISKTIKYNGYHELAYLHPNNFSPQKVIASKYVDTKKTYFILRFAKFGAHHDKGIKGINKHNANEIINILKPFGNIYITSERELEKEFEQYRLNISPIDIHHVMAFANLYIGDSQTMAAEAGVLGTPFVRFNDFVGRINYLNELENKYKLGYGVKTSEPEKLIDIINELLKTPNIKEKWLEKRKLMLSEKIDVAKFFTWLIENYPNSIKLLKENPDYQYNFK